MTQQRATLSIIGLLLVVMVVGLAVRYVRSLDLNANSNTNGMDTAAQTMTITSPAFIDGGMIPVEYTCDGDNTSPTLTWTGAPDGTLSYVLLVHDPDAPTKDWLHWLVVNIPVTTTNTTAGMSPAGGTELSNDSGNTEYDGPCPPNGEHRYLFEIYALDIASVNGQNRTEVEQAMQGHILAKGVITGKYTR